MTLFSPRKTGIILELCLQVWQDVTVGRILRRPHEVGRLENPAPSHHPNISIAVVQRPVCSTKPIAGEVVLMPVRIDVWHPTYRVQPAEFLGRKLKLYRGNIIQEVLLRQPTHDQRAALIRDICSKPRGSRLGQA